MKQWQGKQNMSRGIKMKTKKELVLTTYKDYVRHYGVRLGAKKWKDEKATTLTPEIIKTADKLVVQKIEEEVKEVPIEQIPQEKAEGDIEYREKEIRKMLRTKGWYRYLKPEIELIIKQYEDQYDNVNDIVELKVNQKIRKILQAILDYPKDCLEDAEVLKKERQEEQDALNSVGQEST